VAYLVASRSATPAVPGLGTAPIDLIDQPGAVAEKHDVAGVEVVIVDDHPCVRRGLEAILPSHGVRVTGTAASARTAAEMIERRRPHVALVELQLGVDSGASLADGLDMREARTRVLLFTGCSDVLALKRALRGPVAGLALKTIAIEQLAAGIRAVARGRRFVDAGVSSLLDADAARQRRITERQAEILTLLACGLNVEEAAFRLAVSTATVHKHVQNAVVALGARGRLHAVVLAAQRGDIDLGLGGAGA
jgi:DNA-binding NarL/FixJ family response regulator